MTIRAIQSSLGSSSLFTIVSSTVIVILALLLCCGEVQASVLDNQYDYAVERQRLLAIEAQRHFASDIILSDDEQIVNGYLDAIYAIEQQRMIDLGMS
jgi:hypothetical protein